MYREVSEKSSIQDVHVGLQRMGTISYGTDKTWHFNALGNTSNGVSPTFTIDEIRGVLDMLSTFAQVNLHGHQIVPSK